MSIDDTLTEEELDCIDPKLPVGFIEENGKIYVQHGKEKLPFGYVKDGIAYQRVIGGEDKPFGGYKIGGPRSPFARERRRQLRDGSRLKPEPKQYSDN
tara:strand:- start:15457 stop:15750 length:294 start_codon:yes stop_codon:yes gene_type:complete